LSALREERADQRRPLLVHAIERRRHLADGVERLRVGKEDEPEVLLRPLTERVEERLLRRKVPVDGAHRYPGAHRNYRNRDFLHLLVREHIRRRLQDPKAGLLQLLCAKRALV
jgi:hypothetical protein